MEAIPIAVAKASPSSLPELDAYLEPFAHLFRRRQSRDSLDRYITGLLTDLGRKNCDTIAAAVAGTSTERLQHLLTDADWDSLALDKERVSGLVTSSPPGGILVLDDTGLPKQGRASVGVARQYSGTLGKVGNCQVVVSAEYVADEPASSTPLHWPVSAQLYLPESWATQPERRTQGHIPEEVMFHTKPEIALSLVDRARAWGVPFRLVVADAGYGSNPAFLEGLEARQLLYLCGVEKSFGVRLPDEVRVADAAPPPEYGGFGRPPSRRPAPLYTVREIAQSLPDAAWHTIAWRDGTKGPLRKQFAALRVHWATGNPDNGRSVEHHTVRTGPEGWLLVERPLPGEDGELKFYYSNLPADTTLERLVQVAHARWVIEQFYEDAKGECGLDDYQGRLWEGLHRHIALVMLAYSFLAGQRVAAPEDGEGVFFPSAAAANAPSRASAGPTMATPGPCAVDHGQ